MGFADLHIHTIHSMDGTATAAAILKYAAHFTELDVIAITDHDTIRGALEAASLASKYAIDVIPGIEVTTAEGHLLALWVDRDIPAGLSYQETLYKVGECGGAAIAPHPTHRAAHGVSAETLHSVLGHPSLSKVFLGIETYNAGLIIERHSNERTRLLAATLPLAQVANSDAHTPFMIGAGRTEFHGCTERELRAALETRATRPIAARELNGAAILAEWGWYYTLRHFGLALDNLAPEAGLRLARQSYPTPNLRQLLQGSLNAS